jgi:hypothetical protein
VSYVFAAVKLQVIATAMQHATLRYDPVAQPSMHMHL